MGNYQIFQANPQLTFLQKYGHTQQSQQGQSLNLDQLGRTRIQEFIFVLMIIFFNFLFLMKVIKLFIFQMFLFFILLFIILLKVIIWLYFLQLALSCQIDFQYPQLVIIFYYFYVFDVFEVVNLKFFDLYFFVYLNDVRDEFYCLDLQDPNSLPQIIFASYIDCLFGKAGLYNLALFLGYFLSFFYIFMNKCQDHHLGNFNQIYNYSDPQNLYHFFDLHGYHGLYSHHDHDCLHDLDLYDAHDAHDPYDLVFDILYSQLGHCEKMFVKFHMETNLTKLYQNWVIYSTFFVFFKASLSFFFIFTKIFLFFVCNIILFIIFQILFHFDFGNFQLQIIIFFIIFFIDVIFILVVWPHYQNYLPICLIYFIFSFYFAHNFVTNLLYFWHLQYNFIFFAYLTFILFIFCRVISSIYLIYSIFYHQSLDLLQIPFLNCFICYFNYAFLNAVFYLHHLFSHLSYLLDNYFPDLEFGVSFQHKSYYIIVHCRPLYLLLLDMYIMYRYLCKIKFGNSFIF